jgi:hypothetical protein
MTDLTTPVVPLPVHSPLGGSAAERFIACSGSAALIQRLGRRAVSLEADWTRHGIAAHEVVAACLQQDLDVWEVMDRDWNGITFEPDETASMQFFLDRVRARVEELRRTRGSAHLFVEQDLAHPEIHPLFYGRLDAGIVAGDYAEIIDYKHGEGIAVDAFGNPQLRYYGAGFVYDMHEVEHMGYRIIQPRAFHLAGPDRYWAEPVTKLMHWLKFTLVSAMNMADPTKPAHPSSDARTLTPGEHCRFCPAKLGCPAIKQEMVAVEQTGTLDVTRASHEELGELMKKIPRARMLIKALEDEGLRRMQDGIEIPGQKLVAKKANRVWHPTAEAVMQARFGKEAYATKLKSPAQMEELPGAEELVKEYAYSPAGGMTVAPADDKRKAIIVKRLSDNYPLLTTS